jgi:two-component system invasion response regulator UvrY
MPFKSVLVIDDDVLIHRLIKEEIKDYPGIPDLNVIYATTGETGIEKYIKYKPELVLLDMHLPGIDGLEITKRLMKLNPDINIFLLTSYVTDPNTIKAIEQGARGFISKNDSYISSIVAFIIAMLRLIPK